MSCYHPLKAYRTSSGVCFSELRREDIIGDIEIPCGQCIGCRMRRASDWQARVMHEAQSHECKCFVTLTYASGNLPPRGSLDHGDFQKFMRRLRKSLKKKIRFYMCGEYGDETFRPHYHACLFGVDFREDWVPIGKSKSGFVYYTSQQLERLWSFGNVSVQDLCAETASYCARYIMKKALGETAKTAYQRVDPETGEVYQLKPEYAAMSLKPGIGFDWFQKYGETDVFRHDFVVQDGVKRQVPKYYDKLLRRKKLQKQDDIEFARYKRGRENPEDQTDDRREVREKVHLARVSTLTRGEL